MKFLKNYNESVDSPLSWLKIGEPLKSKKNPTNMFKVYIEFMYGDADGYGHEELLIKKDNPYLERFLIFLDDCIKLYPEGKGGYEGFDEVEGYDIFCNDEDNKSDIHLEWHSDPGSDGQCVSSIEYYSITFFDENGIERHVKVEGE